MQLSFLNSTGRIHVYPLQRPDSNHNRADIREVAPNCQRPSLGSTVTTGCQELQLQAAKNA